MIVLGIILIALILGTWIYSMYVSWKVAQGVPSVLIEAAPFATRWAQILRLTRRGWYSAGMQAKKAFSWSTKRAGTTFMKVFPKSAPAFTKHDAMTGLSQGPSSYFLKSISTPRKTGNKRLPKTQKMI